jgi:cephalosporin hydroxylase
MNISNFFDRLEWKEDRMLLDGHVYRLQHFNGPWTGDSNHFIFYKTRDLVDQYRKFFEGRPDFSPQRIFELGLWDGGSMVFWAELFQPSKHVGVDIQNKQNSPYFQKYLSQERVQGRVKPFWAVDQQDSARLAQIWQTEFGAPLDLVIDDASHLYVPTRTSFEALFPRLRPGGLYIIEDWAWGHWPSFLKPDHVWAAERPPTDFILELLEAVATGRGMIRRMDVFGGFIVVERGDAVAKETFSVNSQIVRREKRPVAATLGLPEAALATKGAYD